MSPAPPSVSEDGGVPQQSKFPKVLVGCTRIHVACEPSKASSTNKNKGKSTAKRAPKVQKTSHNEEEESNAAAPRSLPRSDPIPFLRPPPPTPRNRPETIYEALDAGDHYGAPPPLPPPRNASLAPSTSSSNNAVLEHHLAGPHRSVREGQQCVLANNWGVSSSGQPLPLHHVPRPQPLQHHPQPLQQPQHHPQPLQQPQPQPQPQPRRGNSPPSYEETLRVSGAFSLANFPHMVAALQSAQPLHRAALAPSAPPPPQQQPPPYQPQQPVMGLNGRMLGMAMPRRRDEQQPPSAHAPSVMVPVPQALTSDAMMKIIVRQHHTIANLMTENRRLRIVEECAKGVFQQAQLGLQQFASASTSAAASNGTLV